MTVKRALKDALQDPLVSKPSGLKSEKTQNTSKPTPVQKAGKVVLVSAIVAGFVCGWLAGRFLRVI